MLSNLVSQLKEMGQEDKYEQVLEEVPRVRKDFGEPPLVTPSSQIVGTQAVLNVVSGERYKMVTKESKKLLSGEFGQTVKPFNPEVQKKCIGDTKPITCRPADLIEPQLKKLEAEMSQWKEQDEDVLSYALFPQVAVDFFKYREAQRTKVDATLADKDKMSPRILSPRAIFAIRMYTRRYHGDGIRRSIGAVSWTEFRAYDNQ